MAFSGPKQQRGSEKQVGSGPGGTDFHEWISFLVTEASRGGPWAPGTRGTWWQLGTGHHSLPRGHSLGAALPQALPFTSPCSAHSPGWAQSIKPPARRIPPPLFLFSFEKPWKLQWLKGDRNTATLCLLGCPEEGAGQRVQMRSGVKQNELDNSRSTDHLLTSPWPQTENSKFTCRLR